MRKVMSTGLAAAAAFALAAPAASQDRGTVEIGAFGTRSYFAPSFNMRSGLGGGGRFGAFLAPWVSVEAELGGTQSERATAGLPHVNTWTQSAHVLFAPVRLGPLRVLVGAGMDHVDTYLNLNESYGWHGLAGVSLALGPYAAIRVDGLTGEMTNNRERQSSIRFGLSTFTQPRRQTLQVVQVVPTPEVLRQDSVSAAETARLRSVDSSYTALRDSLNRMLGTPQPTAPVMPDTMGKATRRQASIDSTRTDSLQQHGDSLQEVIQFKRDQSTLGDSAKQILKDKAEQLQANPDMRVVIASHDSITKTENTNMSLGVRRARVTKAYLVSQGVDAARIEIKSRIERGIQVLEQQQREAIGGDNRQVVLLIADASTSVTKGY